jgi:hypothetical protein
LLLRRLPSSFCLGGNPPECATVAYSERLTCDLLAANDGDQSQKPMPADGHQRRSNGEGAGAKIVKI